VTTLYIAVKGRERVQAQRVPATDTKGRVLTKMKSGNQNDI